MSTPNPPSTDQRPVSDPLLQRYQEANAHDATRPSAALRARVLAHARTMAEEQDSQATRERPHAANDSAWKLRALGSLAVLGLVGLLVLQFDRGTPEEQSAAWGPATPRSPSVATTETQTSKAGPTSAPAMADALQEPITAAAQPLPGASADQRSAAPQFAPAMKPQPPQLHGVEDSRSRRETAPALAEIPAAQTGETTSEVAAPEQKRSLDASVAPAMNQVQPLPSAAQDTDERLSTRRDEPLKERSASLAKKSASSTALHKATKAADAEAVNRALAQGALVDATDSEGRTALMLAAQGPSKAVVEQLLQAGADRALRDRQGLNAADHARLAGHLTWLELLQP